MSTCKLILEEQRNRVKAQRWSETGKYRDYLARYADNFIHKLHQDIIEAYCAGAGSEIPPEKDDACDFRWHGLKMVPAKMQAIHSSSALVCNAFGYWHDQRDRSPLQIALGCLSPIENIKFEDTKSTGLRGIPPHLDVVLYCGNMVHAIESKFSEPYQEEKKKIVMGSKSYAPSLWSDKGLRNCADMVDRINDGKMNGKFKYLSANQLLKHVLGLSNEHGKEFELIYLWYEKPGMRESDTHKEEIEVFASMVGDEVTFRSMTYQNLFANLEGLCGCNHRDFLTKLTNRYL